MRKHMILVSYLLVVSALFGGCSNTDNFLYLDALASYEELKQSDKEINELASKYLPLLNEAEQEKAKSVYSSIKAAGEKPDIQTPTKYLAAKSMYVNQAMPLYGKYKDQIALADQALIEEKHEKLKAISLAVDATIRKVVKDEMQLKYIELASRMMLIYAR